MYVNMHVNIYIFKYNEINANQTPTYCLKITVVCKREFADKPNAKQ